MFGIQNFADKLQAAVATSTSDNLPGAIYGALTTWLTTNIWPFIVEVSIVATLLFTFYGAFLYFTAYGDENKATQAKKSITYAIVGFIIALLAWTISNYVQNTILRDQKPQFNVPAQRDTSNDMEAIP
jgi:hypothetical protein